MSTALNVSPPAVTSNHALLVRNRTTTLDRWLALPGGLTFNQAMDYATPKLGTDEYASGVYIVIP